MRLNAAFQPALDEAPGDRLRGWRERLARAQLLARKPERVFELPADVHRAAGGGARAKAEHHRGRERPGLRGVVAHRAHADAGLLRDLAHHGILEALARFDEAGDGGVPPRRPAGLAPEQRAFAVAYQHDDGRIEARKELLPARRVAAAHAVPGVGGARRGAARAAVARAGAPDGECACIGEQPRLGGAQHRGERPQLLEPRALRYGGRGVRRQIDQHAAGAVVPAEQHQLRGRRRADQRRVVGEEGHVRLGLGAEPRARALADEVTGRRRGAGRADPVGILALLGAPLDVRPGEKVRPLVIHPRLSAPRAGAGAGFYWGPREIAHLVRRAAPMGRGRCNFAGWFTGAPAKLRILSEALRPWVAAGAILPLERWLAPPAPRPAPRREADSPATG